MPGRMVRSKIRGSLAGLTLACLLVAGCTSQVVQPMAAAPTPVSPPTPAPTPARMGSLAYALDGDIYVADWDGSNPVKIADGRPSSKCSGNWEYFAEGTIWSPDGRYLAFRHVDCDGPQDAWWDVVITDAKGNIVTSFPSEGWNVPWSPDSTRVAVWERWGEEPRSIGVYGLDGERQMLLTGMPPWGEGDPVWSPNGGSLRLGLDWEIPLDGSPLRQLPWAKIHGDAWATESPDGSLVAYAVRRSLVLAEADGSNPQEVWGDWPGNILWSPAGDRIVFAHSSAGSTKFRMFDLETGEVTLLIEIEGSEVNDLIAFSPEGDRILFSTYDDAGLWSINADGSDLRRLVKGTFWGDWLSPGQAG